jgi:carboxyl-terminal processing protease
MHPSESSRPQRARDVLHLLTGTAFGLSLGLVVWHLRGSNDDPDLARYAEVRDYVREHYVRDVGGEELLDQALHGMVQALDPYSRFYGEAEIAALERETTGHYQGIGVVFAQPTHEARVLYTLPGSPAEKAGLRSGDRILAVAGRTVDSMSPGELRAALGAPDRGEIELALLGRDRLERRISIGQDALVDPTVRHGRIVEPGLGVGYLAILAFSQQTPDEFDREVERLEGLGMRALIVDVRGDLGGVLRSATEIANRFVAEGLLVSHDGRYEAVRYEADPDEATLAGMPLVVLVDGESASASEVFAAALQEHRAAAIVGAPTYGKGMVQQVKAFGGGEMVVKLITSYYYTPSHRNLERTVDGAWAHGLLPDVQVDLSEAEVDAIHDYLQSYSPPEHCLAELETWERDEGRTLYARPPPDAQLEAAIALFRGERPHALVAASPGGSRAAK